MLIAAIFWHSFYIVVSYLGGIVPWPHPCRPLAEIRDRKKNIKENINFFRDYVFGTKNRQNRDRFKVKSFF